MKDNLTKKQIEILDTGVLNTRYCWLKLNEEKMPGAVVMLADAREMLVIKSVLRKRLVKLLGRDFYPPTTPSIPKATQIIHPCSAAVTKKVEAEMETESKSSFKIIITSSVGSVVTQQNVKVDSKSEADVKARELIEQLGLKKATYKIS